MKFRAVAIYSILTIQFIVGSNVVSGQTVTVTADFGGRSNTAHRIPPKMFGANLASIQNSSVVALLPVAGITEGRRAADMSVVYATATPDWSQMDWAMNEAKIAGVHPLLMLYGTPRWLQPSPNPCSSSPRMAAPVDYNKWAAAAAAVVGHLDSVFPGLVEDFEIWNEPDLQQSLCVADNTDATRLRTYLALYAAAASAMRSTAKQDGVNIRIGGPVMVRLSLAPEWIPALLSNSQTAPNVDFVSFHFYPTGTAEIQAGMTWGSLYARTQSLTNGLPFYYSQISSLVKKGSQPNPGSTPVYISEFNDNWSFTKDCCRNDPTYAPLWSGAVVSDLLDSVYSGANVPGKFYYYAGSEPPFCMFGTWDSSMDCNAGQMDPYPQYYLYQLIASEGYLGLEAGGYVAASVVPASTQSGLMATAFYTHGSDSVVIMNPTSTGYSGMHILAANTGYVGASATVYLLNEAHQHIQNQTLALAQSGSGLNATIDVPPYSTVAVKITGSVAVPPTPVLVLTPRVGTAPQQVAADSSLSSDNGSPVTSRSIDFGDGSAPAKAVTASHIYTASGTYRAKLVVTGGTGLTSQVVQTVQVEALENVGFESGAGGWQCRNASVLNNASNAHSGQGYLELSSSATTHPVCFAIDGLDSAIYFPITPGQTITFGGWADRLYGNGFGRWVLELVDSNLSGGLYVAASPNPTQGAWTHQQNSLVVPAGKSFARFYAEVYQSTVASKFRFDDALLQIH